MNNTVQHSTLNLIKNFEGCVLHPYKDNAGIWTIGYGFTRINGVPVTATTHNLTQDEADSIFEVQLASYADAVDKAVTVPLNQNQFDACVSLCYNIGIGGFQSSTVCRQINRGDFIAAEKAFSLWTKSGGKTDPNLVARRLKERQIFTTDI